MSGGAEPGWRRDRALLVILGVALVLRLGSLWAGAGARPGLDELLYLQRALALLEGQGFLGSYQSWVLHPDAPMMAALPQYPGSYQPPFYPLFLAAVLALGGRSLLAVQLVQVALGLLTVGLVYGLGRAWFGRRAGLIAAAWCAVSADLVCFAHYYFSETLFVCLLVAVLYLLVRGAAPPAPAAAAAAGLLAGLAALTRGVAVYALPLLAAWLVWRHAERAPRALRRAALFLLAAALPIVPWSVRSTRLHGGFVLIDTNGPFNLWRGNAPDTFADRAHSPEGQYAAPFDGLPLMPVARQTQRVLVETCRRELGHDRPTDLEIASCASALALREIRAHPGVFLRRAVIKLIDLWNPTSWFMRRMRTGAYGHVLPLVEGLLTWAAVCLHVALLALAAAGAWLARRRPETWLLLGLVGYFSAVHAVSFGLTRFRLPMLPLLMLLAGCALAGPWRAARRSPH